MNRQSIILICGGIMAALLLSLGKAGAPPQQSQRVQKAATNQPSASSGTELDRMIADGKSQRELAQYLFDTHGCRECHTIGQEGKLGFTAKGKEKAQGFEGCIATLKAMSIVAKVPEDRRSATQRQRAAALRGVRLRRVPQAHSRQDGADRSGSEAGASAFRLRGCGEASSQRSSRQTMTESISRRLAVSISFSRKGRVVAPEPTSLTSTATIQPRFMETLRNRRCNQVRLHILLISALII